MYSDANLAESSTPRHRRHPLQLCRQMEQEELPPPHTADEPFGNNHWQLKDKTEDNPLADSAPASSEIPASTMTAIEPSPASDKPSSSAHHRASPRPHLPPTQGSQGSSSTGSGATGTSIGTNSGGGSVSSGKSGRGYYRTSAPGGRGNRCSSSASSSTEETEARERRFGSVDLHPLPLVTLNPAGVRRSLVSPSTGPTQQLHLAALLTLQQQFAVRSAALATAARVTTERGDSLQMEAHSSSQPSVPTSNSTFPTDSMVQTTPVTTQSAATLMASSDTRSAEPHCVDSMVARLANQSQFHPLNLLPPVFWPCLVCPVHAGVLLHSSGLLLNELDKAKDRHGSSGLGTSAADHTAQPTKPQSDATGHDVVPSLWMGSVSTGGLTTSTPRIGPYELGPTLGRGNFAVVKLARHIETKVKVAIKIMNKELIGSVNLNKVSRELEAMKRCQHPHIIRLYHVMESESNIFMVTEYASRGEVFDHISKSHAFNEKEARELFWQIVCAIDFCHNSGVVHRDLKAENLLLDSELKIKVADFGFCNFFQPNELLSTHCGSPQYAAPELFKGEPYDGPLADVWSLGVILYILVCGSFPFPGESLGDIRTQVLRGLVRFPFFLSTACEQVIRCMLQVDPARRFKLKQIISMPWMQASPNVAHYQATMIKFEEKAKERHFDEIFRRQYPEHSELVKVEQVERAERRLDAGVLRALAIGAGFDESQVRTSTLQNKCDRFHAAYQLLVEKIRRFSRSPHLCQAVNDAVFAPKVRRRSSGLLGRRSSSISSSPVGISCPAMLSHNSSGASIELSETTTIRHGVQLATVPDVIDESMAEAENETAEPGTVTDNLVSTTGTATSHSPSIGSSSALHDKAKDWYSQSQPGCVELNVALFILKADEDALLLQLGVVSPLVATVPISNAVRRHTVQLTGSPLAPQSQIPHSGLETNQANTKDQVMNQGEKSHRLPGHPFSRQTTQPHIGGLKHYKDQAERQEALIRTAFNWMPDPLHFGREFSPSDETDSNYATRHPHAIVKRPLDLPSLELGQEAATTCPPDRPHRPGLQRGSSMQDSDDENVETAIQERGRQFQAEQPEATPEGAYFGESLSLTQAGYPIVDFPTAQADAQPGSSSSKMPPWDLDVRDGAYFDRKPTAKLVDPTDESTGNPVAMETDPVEHTAKLPTDEVGSVAERGYWSSAHVEPDGNEEGSVALGALLPQLNLPANLPAMIHQPVAKFTVKDPHLLAPPEFMTPQCSSFPRRSSDGAAELQPLQRPGLTVGGSYPEQTNYRNMHSGSETDTSTLKTSPTNEPMCCYPHQSSGQSTALDLTQKSLTAAQTEPDRVTAVNDKSTSTVSAERSTERHQRYPTPRSIRPVGTKLRASPAVLAAQQRSLFSALRSASTTASRTTATWWRPPGAEKAPEPADSSEFEGDERQKTEALEAQLTRYQKRFSLPVRYAATEGVTMLGDLCQFTATGCTCHYPLTPEMAQEIHQLFANKPATMAEWPQLTSKSTWTWNSSSCSRRGSEASQMIAWKHRLNQCGYLRDPSVDESIPFDTTAVLANTSRPLPGSDSDPNTQFMVKDSKEAAYAQPPDSSDPRGVAPSSGCLSSEVGSPISHHDHQSMLSADWPELDSAGQPQSLLPQPSPPGIHLSELKTELHKLESESETNLCSQDRTGDTVNVVASASASNPQAFTRFLRRFHRSHEGTTTCPISYSPAELPGWSHRPPSSRNSRRASSVASATVDRDPPPFSYSGTDGEANDMVQRRHRYSVGSSLEHTFSDQGDFPLVVPKNLPPPLSCQPSVTGLHSQSVTHHRSVAPTLSNPDHPYPRDPLHASYLFGAHLPVALDLNRTALSSPGPSSGMTPMEFPMLVDSTGTVHTSMPSNTQKQYSQATETVETIVAPASTGMKRRLLGTSHQSKQSHDYLRTLQHPGGSLDRRWDFDFLTSPKRKIYQEWLPKVTAFSRKAAVTMLQAVHSRETRSHDTGKSETESPVIVSSPGLLDLSSVSPTSPRMATAPQIPSAPMSTHSSTAASLGNMDQESDDHFDEDAEDLEEERECQLAPLQSHLTLPTRTRSTFTSLPVGSMEPTSPLLPLYVPDRSQQAQTQFTGSRLPATYPTSSSFPLTAPTDFQSPTLMFFHPGDDDDDLAEIDRVNRRLAMSGGLLEFTDTPAYMGCPSSRTFLSRPPPQMFPASASATCSFQPADSPHEPSPSGPSSHSQAPQ
ncbi:serine/threonine-protein kinase SIK3 [Clonorchis sinensis]|uniref:non-specific serine/threonine protein kinase n=1 Tax=Clonorchis sinensis TaxID=79923 RepID=G7YVK4_CLOSI|nr:serine/threonine-protein kinase SIK3 [Clonorchis sinensis]